MQIREGSKMLNIVKLALRISTTSFDDELNLLISDCLSEMTHMGIAGAVDTSTDTQIKSTVIAYCKWKFGNNEDKEQWERIYHIKLAQLKSMTDYGFPGETPAEAAEDPEEEEQNG